MKKLLLLLILAAAGGYFFFFKSDKEDKTVAKETPSQQPTAKKETPVKKVPVKTLDPFAQMPSGGMFKDQAQLQNFWHSSRNFHRRDTAKEAELQAKNPAWKIEKLWQVTGTQKIYTSTSDDKGNIYFLTADNFDYQIYRISGNAAPELCWSLPKLRDGGGDALGMFMTIKVDKAVLLATEGRYVWISQPGKKVLFRLSHFPFIIKDLWFQDDRLMLLGEKQLMSCDRQGKVRKTHFAANQAGKSLSLFQNNPQAKFFAGGMGNAPDEVILFYSGMPSALGKYSLSKNEFTEIASLPGTNEQNYIYYVTKFKDSYLYSWAARPDCGINMQFIYSLKENKLTVLGSRINDYLKSFWKGMPSNLGITWNPMHNVAGPIAYNGKYLLYSGGNGTGHAKYQRESSAGCAGIVDLTRYPEGVSLKYPAVNGLYFAKDGKSLLAVEYAQVTLITPKN